MRNGMTRLGLALALAITGTAAAHAAEWDETYEQGRAHLEKGETQQAMTALDRALGIAGEGMEKANTLYMLAAASFQARDYERAADRLDEIIAYHDAGGFDDVDFLKNVLRRAAMVAHQRQDREAVDAYTARRMEIDATNPAIWEIDRQADTYRHKATGILYRPEVAGFERQGISVFKPDGTDVGGDYVLTTEDGEISIMVYATQNIPLTGEQHLHSAVQSLRAEMNIPELVTEGDFAPWGNAGPVGQYQIYRASMAATPTESGLWVVADGNTHYKMRASYRARMSEMAVGAIDRFIADFGWPKVN